MQNVKYRDRSVGHILPYDFDKTDCGGLDHLKAVIASRGYLSEESNWCDSPATGSDESHLATIVASHRGACYSDKVYQPKFARQERLQNEFELEQKRRRIEQMREADKEWAAAEKRRQMRERDDSRHKREAKAFLDRFYSRVRAAEEARPTLPEDWPVLSFIQKLTAV